MKNRSIFVTALGFLLVAFISISILVHSEAANIPAEKIVKTKYDDKIAIANINVFKTLEYPAVIFDHDKHTEVLGKEDKGCDTCHPFYNKTKNLIQFTFPKNIKNINKASPTTLMNAYHSACIGCHERRIKEGKKAGPITCGNCHVKGINISKFKYPKVDFDFKLHDTHVTKLKEHTLNKLQALGLESPIVINFEPDNINENQKKLIEQKSNKQNCALCHHQYNVDQKKLIYEIIYRNGKEIQRAWACEDCHDYNTPKSPILANDISITTQKDLSVENADHMKCLNCHLIIAKEEGANHAGPLLCYKCHERKPVLPKEPEHVSRPNAGQTATYTIDVKDAKMKSVPFDHAFHEQHINSCRSCHHETLYNCDKCHTLHGSVNGAGINTLDAYHDTFSDKSCIGCHKIQEIAKNCSGCHRQSVIDKEPSDRMCSKCHNGLNRIAMPPTLTTTGLNPNIVKKEVIIKELENQFKPVKYPHEKILIKLAEVSNTSKLATYFHGNIQTLCEGCHHHGYVDAQINKDEPPSCGNCHSKYFEPLALNRPRLLAAYHEMCIQCHKQMGLSKPKACKDCHEFANKEQGKI